LPRLPITVAVARHDEVSAHDKAEKEENGKNRI
jgi:hypothetical protein